MSFRPSVELLIALMEANDSLRAMVPEDEELQAKADAIQQALLETSEKQLQETENK